MALVDRAILDALCRLQGVTVTQAIRSNLAGIDIATAPDLAGFNLSSFLAGLAPARTIAARHTVGLVDAITEAEVMPSDRLSDGLPESLEAAIDSYGLTFFKVKVSGQLDADIDRLTKIASLIDAKVPRYSVTLDGNEQFSSADAVAELLTRIKATRSCRNLQMPSCSSSSRLHGHTRSTSR